MPLRLGGAELAFRLSQRETATDRTFDGQRRTIPIVEAKLRAGVVAEFEFGDVPLKVLLTAVLIDA